MAGHTPGPWTVDNCGRDVRAGGIGGLFVARIYAVPQEDNPSGYGDEQLANARLIAEAPVLLKALETVRSYTRTMVEAECVAEEPWMRDLYALLDRINE